MAYNAIPTRPHVRPSMLAMELIGRGTCWHFDAWMLRHPVTGVLYIKIQTRAGGRELLTEHEYIVENGRMRYAATIPSEAEPITMHDKAEWSRFDELNALHHKYVLPMAARVPDNFRSRSVALHYVRAPSLPPFEGDEVNLHQYGEK